MIDVDHANENPVLDYLVDNTELTTSRGVQTKESSPQRLADSVRVLCQWTSNEFPARDSCCFRQVLGQRPARSGGQFNFIRQRGSRPASRIACSTSSSE